MIREQLDELTDQLAADAIAIALDIREDVDQVHRTLLTFDELKLRQVCCVLAAMVDPDRPLHEVAWWRDLPEAREAA